MTQREEVCVGDLLFKGGHRFRQPFDKRKIACQVPALPEKNSEIFSFKVRRSFDRLLGASRTAFAGRQEKNIPVLNMRVNRETQKIRKKNSSGNFDLCRTWFIIREILPRARRAMGIHHAEVV